MSKGGVGYEDYIRQNDSTKFQDELAALQDRGNIFNANPLGVIIHSLLMKRLQKRASKEKQENSRSRAAIYAKLMNLQQQQGLDAETRRAVLKQQSKDTDYQRNRADSIAKEVRDYKKEIAKENRKHSRTLGMFDLQNRQAQANRTQDYADAVNKARDVGEINDVFNKRKNFRKQASALFGNPIEAINFMANPDVSQVEPYDTRGMKALVTDTIFNPSKQSLKLRYKK